MQEVIDKEVFISRSINARIETVFEAWTNVHHLEKWHAPDGCTISYKKADIKPGGEFHSCIHVPNMKDCWCKGVYIDIEKNRRIEYTMINCDENGNDIDPTDIGMDKDWPVQTRVVVLFEEEDGKTKLTLHQTVSEALAKKTGAYPSWLLMLDKLEKFTA